MKKKLSICYFSFLVLIIVLMAINGCSSSTEPDNQISKNPDPPELTDHGSVLPLGSHGEWDSRNVLAPSVVLDGDTLRMWYSGMGAEELAGISIGYAKSTDGINWVKYQNNPVFPTENQVSWCSVIKDGNLFKMWYIRENPWFSGNIYLATSSDGINWDEHGLYVFKKGGGWEEDGIGLGNIMKEDGEYKMWYRGMNGHWMDGDIQIGFASSSDGISWERDEKNPRLRVSNSTGWDNLIISFPSVVKTDEGYEMLYAGRSDNETWVTLGLGYALSQDGKTWTRYTRNPLLDLVIGAQVYANSIIFYDNTYHIWYTRRQDDVFKLGYMTGTRD